MSAKGYLITEVRIKDPDAMARYRELATPAVALYGGRFLARGGACEVLEGDVAVPERLIVTEFDSVEQARRFYHSPEYAAARQMREGAGEMQILLLSGVEAIV